MFVVRSSAAAAQTVNQPVTKQVKFVVRDQFYYPDDNMSQSEASQSDISEIPGNSANVAIANRGYKFQNVTLESGIELKPMGRREQGERKMVGEVDLEGSSVDILESDDDTISNKGTKEKDQVKKMEVEDPPQYSSTQQLTNSTTEEVPYENASTISDCDTLQL